MNEYEICYRCTLPINTVWPASCAWDIFISAYTRADRVLQIYDKSTSVHKHWLVFPEYCFPSNECPNGAFIFDTNDEADYISRFISSIDINETSKICIDTTGFIRPYLVYIIGYLESQGIKEFDAIYTEPVKYAKRENTNFSLPSPVLLRQIAGFEGVHSTDTSHDLLLINSGYDHELISLVAENKKHANKVQLFGFPSLRADMFQENMLRAYQAEEAIGARDENSILYAPANDPFATAQVLHDYITKREAIKEFTNFYFSPIATKPQVIGFTLFFLKEMRNRPASMLFPFSTRYSEKTSTGISRIWKYHIEL
jgi:hypothetical protein